MDYKNNNHFFFKMKLIISILFFLCTSSCFPNFQDKRTSNTLVTHSIESNQKLKLLWDKKIHIIGDNFGNPCAALGSSVFLLNKEETKKNLQLNSMDSNDGKTIWAVEGGSQILVGDSKLIMSSGQTIFSLSPENGNVIWEKFLLESRYIGNMYLFEDRLYVNSSGISIYILDPTTGHALSKYPFIENFREKHPSIPFIPDLNFQPTQFKDSFIWNDGDGVYTITHENIKSHKKIWEKSIDSISNSVIIGEEIFYISKDSKLKIIDINTGELIQEFQINPSIDFFNLDKNVQHDGYYLCSEGNEKKLYMVLGDSQQMFAFYVND